MEDNSLLKAALDYARHGRTVFPCEGKKPLTEHGLKDATIDEQTIRAWWTRWPDANIGHQTGHHVVLDVDGPEGESALVELQAKHSPLPETLTARTGRGRHLYFAANGAKVRNSAGRLGPHLDVRGEGGYVILPPSVHENGKRYEWADESMEPAPIAAWLVALLTEPKTQSESTDSKGKIPHGRRDNYLTSLAGVMRRKGMSESAMEAALLAENKARCDPPLPTEEVKRIAHSVGRYPPGEQVPVPGVLASAVKPENVDWLWKAHFALRKITTAEGDPDEGKSTDAIDIAARVTTGSPMPDGSAGIPPAGAVIVSLEDGIADTILPRLIAANADLSRCRIIQTIKCADGVERTPTLPVDLPAIEAAIRDVDAKILVIDPFVATLGADTNSFRDQDIRRVLAPVAALAERTGVAVIIIRHLNKSNNPNPKYRGGGSIGIIGAARAAFLFGENPDEDGSKIMACLKMNIAEKPPAMKYRLERRHIMFEGESIETVGVRWEGETTHTAKSILAEPETEEDSNAVLAGKLFLTEFLSGGPQDSKDIIREARQAGVSERTLWRAKALLGVRAVKWGMGGGWQWELPKAANTKAANSENVADFEKPSEKEHVSSTAIPKAANSEGMAGFGPEDGNLRAYPDTLEL